MSIQQNEEPARPETAASRGEVTRLLDRAASGDKDVVADLRRLISDIVRGATRGDRFGAGVGQSTLVQETSLRILWPKSWRWRRKSFPRVISLRIFQGRKVNDSTHFRRLVRKIVRDLKTDYRRKSPQHSSQNVYELDPQTSQRLPQHGRVANDDPAEIVASLDELKALRDLINRLREADRAIATFFILRAFKEMTEKQASKMVGLSDRQMRRKTNKDEESGQVKDKKGQKIMEIAEEYLARKLAWNRRADRKINET